MKRSDLFFTALLLPLDYIAMVASFLLAYYLRGQYPTLIPRFLLGHFADALHYSPELPLLSYHNYLSFILWGNLAIVIIFIFTGLYRVQRFSTISKSSAQVIRSTATAFLVLVIASFIYGSTVLPRLVILYAVLISIVALLAVRLIVQALRVILQRRGVGVLRVAILGEGKNAARAKLFIGTNRRNGYRLVREYTVAQFDKLASAITHRKIDELIIADHQIGEETVFELRELCVENRVGFLFVPKALEMLTVNVIVREVRGFPLIEVPLTPLEGWGYLVKRVLDIICSTFGLIILSPVYALVALLIYLDSPGPVFFKHQRLGQNLQPFYLYKFRTMKTEYCDGIGYNRERARQLFKKMLESSAEMRQDWEEYHKLKNDPRVTRLGHWLRKLSLDELPQIFNVLRGDLSLVGPRPIVKAELEKYGRMRWRLGAIKPGISGLWQVSGRNDTTYEERVRLDTIYVETWSLWLDLIILLKTVSVLISSAGAY